MRAVTFLVWCGLLLLIGVSAIHEDEQGLRDFLLRFVGDVKEAVAPPSDSPNLLFVRSEQGAVAAISTTSYGGLNLTWRQTFTEKPLCVAASHKSVIVVGERGSVHVLNSQHGDVETTFLLKTEDVASLSTCSVERDSVNIVSLSAGSLHFFTFSLDSEEELIEEKKSVAVSPSLVTLKISGDNVATSSEKECVVFSLSTGAEVGKHSFPCRDYQEGSFISKEGSTVTLYKGAEKATQLSGQPCDALVEGQSVISVNQVENGITVQFPEGTVVTVANLTSQQVPTLLTAYSRENSYCALVKGGNNHLYLVCQEGLVWERKEGLSNPSAVAIVDPIGKIDHFHFDMHVLTVSPYGVLYDIPLQDMGKSVHVLGDFSRELVAKTNQPMDQHQIQHVETNAGVVYITSRHQNALSSIQINLLNSSVSIQVFNDALAISQNGSISNSLEVQGVDAADTFFYTTDLKSGVLKGFKLMNQRAVPVWTVRLHRSIVSHSKGSKQRSDFVNALHVFPNQTGEEPVEEVRHKYPTKNVIAVTHYETVEGELPTLVVTVIDAVTGSVLGVVRHKNVEGNVPIVVVENNVVYHFMDAEKVRYVMGVIELFEEENGPVVKKSTGASPPQVIASFFTKKDRVFSSNAAKPPVLVPSTLGIQGGPLSAMGVTTSANGIARKNIVLVFESGRVALVELRLLVSGGQMPFPDDKDRRITHVFIPSLLLATHKYRIASPSHVVTEPTHLESSCHLVVSGLDFFYVRASSGKPFDLLNSDFNKSLLISLVCGFAFLSFAVRYLVKRAHVNSLWK